MITKCTDCPSQFDCLKANACLGPSHPGLVTMHGSRATLSMLEEAAAAVKQRRSVYGSPAPNFQRIADFWNVYWAHRTKLAHQSDEYLSFNTTDVATLMRLVKEARLIETPDHRDSLVDIAGYADCQVECSSLDTVKRVA